jgi:hypothetical protein
MDFESLQFEPMPVLNTVLAVSFIDPDTKRKMCAFFVAGKCIEIVRNVQPLLHSVEIQIPRQVVDMLVMYMQRYRSNAISQLMAIGLQHNWGKPLSTEKDLSVRTVRSEDMLRSNSVEAFKEYLPALMQKPPPDHFESFDGWRSSAMSKIIASNLADSLPPQVFENKTPEEALAYTNALMKFQQQTWKRYQAAGIYGSPEQIQERTQQRRAALAKHNLKIQPRAQPPTPAQPRVQPQPQPQPQPQRQPQRQPQPSRHPPSRSQQGRRAQQQRQQSRSHPRSRSTSPGAAGGRRRTVRSSNAPKRYQHKPIRPQYGPMQPRS